MDIKIINKSNNPDPAYETEFSAGMDLRAFTDEDIILGPGERKMIHTGIYLEIPEGYEGQVRPRSGLAVKYGITVLNAPGTIDSDYRGEVCVILYSTLAKDGFVIKNGDRIAQLVFSKCERANLIKSNELSDTERGDGGFGHTGVK